MSHNQASEGDAAMEHLIKIREFVVDNFLFGDDSRLADETPFLEGGIIDSTGMLELISFLEETYSISLEDEELVPENLGNLNNVSRFLEKKLNVSCEA